MISRPDRALLAAALAAGSIANAPPAMAQSAPASTNAASIPAASYRPDFAAVQMAMQKLDEDSAFCHMSSLAQTGQGRDVFLLTLSADPAKAADSQPAVLIVAGLDGRHRVGVETALRVAEQMLKGHAELLKDTAFYIMPCANPDGFEANSGKVNVGHIGNMHAVDSDRDGTADEDSPADINNDGVITQMRRLAPPLDDRATHMPDPNEPRLLKRADAAKGERALYSLYPEGLDADGDGEIAEDAVGFVDLDRNFMHRYPEHASDAGVYPLSEPEALALADFVIKRKNLIAVITYGRHDNMINVPDGRGTEISGQGPRDLDAGDVEYYREISKKYKEFTGQSRAAGGDTAGSFQAWVYAQRGIPSFATTLWGRPEEPRPGGDAGGSGGAAPQRDPVSGVWAGSVEVPEIGEVAYTITLTLAADNSIAGSTTAMGMTVPLSGTFEPSTGKARLVGEFGGENATYDVVFNGEELTGTYSQAGTSMEFSAQRNPAPSAAGGGEAPPQAPATRPAEAPTPAPAAQETAQQPPAGGPPGGGRRGGGRGGSGEQAPGAGGGAGGGGGGADANRPEDGDGAAWLKYSDAMRNKEGFIEWKPFDHPTLGRVEIGGFVPGFQMNPPASDLDDIGVRQTAFAVEIIGRRPRLNVQGPEVTRLADGLYEIRLGILNEGYLPTANAMARKARSIFPTIVRISTPIDNIVSGDKQMRTFGVGGSGDRIAYHWIVRAANGSDITIEITNPHLGDRIVTFKAEEKK